MDGVMTPYQQNHREPTVYHLAANASMPDQAVILLAEDREDDILLIRKAFQKAFINNPLQVVRDGEEAIAYLSGEGKYSNRSEYPLPGATPVHSLNFSAGVRTITWIAPSAGGGRS